MKNLKKVLCLALAFAMVLGLCVSGLAAVDVTTLSDWDEVANKDAVKLLNAFDIMQGDERGVRPDDTLTRAEAAKMLSVALWGGRDDNKLYAAGNAGNFSDVDTSLWYIGYVNFMAVNGIIQGDAEGTFRPTATVSGYELLKMALTTLGYDAEKSGLVGAGWDLRTMSLATKRTANKDLTDDTTVTNWSAPITRTNAAQVISNMVYRQLVSYTEKGVLVEDDTNGLGTFATAILGMETRTGTLIANATGATEQLAKKDLVAIDADENAIIRVTANKTGDTLAGKYAVTVDSSFADLGMPVSVYFADGKPVQVTIKPYTAIEPTFNQAGAITNIADGYDVDSDIWNFAGQATDVNNSGTTDMTDLLAILGTSADEVTCYTNVNKTYGEGIQLVVAHELDTVKTIVDVLETEEYGTVYTVAKNVKWDAKKYAAGTLANAIAAIDCDFTAEKGDKVIYVAPTNKNIYGTQGYHGVVLTLVEGTVDRSRAATATALETLYIDGEAHKNEGYAGTPVTAGVKSTGKFWLYANGNIQSCDVSTPAGAVPSTYALVYNAYVTTIQGTVSNTGDATSANSYINQVAAVLPDGTNKWFEVAKVFTITADSTYATDGAMKIDTTAGKTITASTADLTDSGAILNGVPNTVVSNTKTDGANKLVPYTLNDDGTINLYVYDTANVTDPVVGNSTVNIPSTGTGAKVVSSTTPKIGDKFATAKTVTYVQTQKLTNTKDEAWAVRVGLTTESYTVDDLSKVQAVLGTANGIANSGVAYLNVGALDTTTTTSDLFYVLRGEEQTTTGYDAVVFNATTGKVETINYTTAASAVKDTLWTTLSTTLGGQVKTDTTNWDFGYITSNENGVVAISKWNSGATRVDTTPYLTNKDTKVVKIVDTEDSALITVADIEAQVATTAITATTYNTGALAAVLEDGSDNAVMIVLFPSALTTTVAP